VARRPVLPPRRWLRTDEGWLPGEDLVRAAGAVAIALLAVGVKLLISVGLGWEPGYLSYVGAVALAAWVAGLRGGTTTAVICVVGDSLLFNGGPGELVASPNLLFRMAMFAFDAALVILLTSGLRREMVRWQAAQATGEQRLAELAAAYAASEQDRATLDSLQAVTSSLAGAATPSEVGDAILDRGIRALGAIAGAVSELSDDGRSLELLAARGYPEDALRSRASHSLDEASHLRDALIGRRAVFLVDPDDWRRRYPDSPPAPLDGSPDGGAIAVIPLLVSGRTIGAVVFRFAGRDDLREDVRDLAQRLADQGAQALDRALAYDRERAARHALESAQGRMRFLALSSDVLGSGADIEACLRSVARAAIPTMADWCLLQLWDREPNLSAVAANAGREEAVDRLATLVRPGRGRELLADADPQGAATIEVGDAWKRLGPALGEVLLELEARCLLVAPITGPGGDRLGVIVFGSAAAARFGPDDQDMVRELAARTAAAAERHRLFASVTRFKATVDAAADAVFMFDPDSHRVTYANRGGSDLVATSPDELLGQSILRLYTPSNRPVFRQRLADLREDPGRPIAYTDVLARRDGREVPVEAVLQEVVLPDGGATAILTARDISDRIDIQSGLARLAGEERRKAAELRAVIEAMGDGVLVVGPDEAISLANEAALAALSGDVRTMADLRERLGLAPPGEDAGADAIDLRRVPLTAQVPGERWLEVTMHAADLGGSITAELPMSWIVVLRDVTRAREAEAAREAFLGVLSHELRTPVTTIFGYAKVLKRQRASDDQAAMLDDIEAEADRLYHIVEDLLALSRVEAGITIDAEPLLLQHVARPAIGSEAQRWSSVTFEFDLPSDLPVVFAERTYVEQVLRNLASNAGKYSPPDTVVTIQAEATPTEVLVRVLDRGSGINADETERLFDLHYRSPRTAGSVAGAGIGLYVCRGLVDAMGGAIWARPRPGGGSEFGFSLPRAVEDVAAPVTARRSRAAGLGYGMSNIDVRTTQEHA
jgi:PAS domain S-box-containing protein